MGENALDLFKNMDTGKLTALAEDRGRSLRLLAEILRQQKHHDAAEAMLRESASIYSQVGDQLEQGRSNVALGNILAEKGRREEALDLLQKARAIFAKLGAKLDLEKVTQVLHEIK